MTTEQQKYLDDCRKRYAADLTDDILPFWMKHGLDREHGGIYTCVDRDGTRMDTTKSVWFQGRFGYVCAAAYRHAGGIPSGSRRRRARWTSSNATASTPTDTCFSR